MRRSIILTSALAIAAAFSAACDPPKPEAPKTPTSTPTPAVATTPAPSATGSPTSEKPGTTPEVKKDEAKPTTDGKNVNKDVKPATTPK
ncbi:MAG: hypothetical protein WBO10_09495 [Pyrinomonadaceae bacterium]